MKTEIKEHKILHKIKTKKKFNYDRLIWICLIIGYFVLSRLEEFMLKNKIYYT